MGQPSGLRQWSCATNDRSKTLGDIKAIVELQVVQMAEDLLGKLRDGESAFSEAAVIGLDHVIFLADV